MKKLSIIILVIIAIALTGCSTRGLTEEEIVEYYRMRKTYEDMGYTINITKYEEAIMFLASAEIIDIDFIRKNKEKFQGILDESLIYRLENSALINSSIQEESLDDFTNWEDESYEEMEERLDELSRELGYIGDDYENGETEHSTEGDANTSGGLDIQQADIEDFTNLEDDEYLDSLENGNFEESNIQVESDNAEEEIDNDEEGLEQKHGEDVNTQDIESVEYTEDDQYPIYDDHFRIERYGTKEESEESIKRFEELPDNSIVGTSVYRDIAIIKMDNKLLGEYIIKVEIKNDKIVDFQIFR